jgi:hypothetical protein
MMHHLFATHSWVFAAVAFNAIVSIAVCVKCAVPGQAILAECLLAIVASGALMQVPPLMPENTSHFDELCRVMAGCGAVLGTVAVSAVVSKRSESVWAVVTAGLLGGVFGSTAVAITVVALYSVADPVIVLDHLPMFLLIICLGVCIGAITGALFGCIWGYALTAAKRTACQS